MKIVLGVAVCGLKLLVFGDKRLLTRLQFFDVALAVVGVIQIERAQQEGRLHGHSVERRPGWWREWVTRGVGGGLTRGVVSLVTG